MLSIPELLGGLAQCIGTEGYHFNRLHGKHFVYTDGIRFLLEQAECYWLLDAIFSYRRTEEFQFWTLEVFKDKTALLTMKEDSNSPLLVEQKIHYTTFPLEKIELYAINDHCREIEGGEMEYGNRVVLLLPSEN